MSSHKQSTSSRWWGLAAVLALLTVVVILLGTRAVAAEGAVPPPALSGRMDTATLAGSTQQVNPGYTVDLIRGVIWGRVGAGELVTVTRDAGGDMAFGAAEADGLGFFWTPFYASDGSGVPRGLAGGDVISIYLNGGLDTVIQPLTITGEIHILDDEVTGTIETAGSGVPVTVTVGVDGTPPGSGAPQMATTTDANGDFEVTFSDIDLGPANLVAVDYELSGNHVRSYFYPSEPALEMRQYNQVSGYAPWGTPVTATVYMTYPTDVRWQTQDWASFPFGYFALNAQGPDAQPTDVVELEYGDGTTINTTLVSLWDLTTDVGAEEVSGEAPEGETVLASMWQVLGNERIYAETSTVAEAGNLFTATFATADVRVRDTLEVSVDDTSGNRQKLYTGAPSLVVQMDPSSPWDCVNVVADGPYLPITFTLNTGIDVYTRTDIGVDAGNGTGWACYLMWDQDQPVDFSAGNIITVESPTWEGSVTIADATWLVDTVNDQVSGEAPAGDLEVEIVQWYGGMYPINGSAIQTATAASPYTAQFTDFDVRDGGTVAVKHYDPATDFATWWYGWGNIQYQFFEVNPPYGVGGFAPSANEVITAHLYDTYGGTMLAETSTDKDTDDPWRFWLDEFGEDGIQPGNWVTVTGESGWASGMEVPTLTIDISGDLIWGEGPKALVMVEHGRETPEGWDGNSRFVPVDGYARDVSFFGRHIQEGDAINAIYQSPGGDFRRAEYYWPHINMSVNYAHDWVAGQTTPNSTVVITVNQGAGGIFVGTGQSGGDGGLRPEWVAWTPEQPNIQPGDMITASAAGVTATVNPVGTIDGTLDGDNNTVSGHIWASGFPTVTVRCDVWTNGPGPESIVITDVVGNGGSYSCDFGAKGWDIQPEDQVVVWYVEPDGDEVGNVFQLPWMRVNYGHDWVGGTYEAGHTFWITVTDSVDVPKGTCEVTSEPGGGWGGDGFETRYEDWPAGAPDIVPGDKVHISSNDGYTNLIIVGEIQGTVSIAADSVGGPIYASHLLPTTSVNVRCEIWGGVQNVDGKDSSAGTEGDSPYFCQWDPGSEWDIEHGYSVAVMYIEPDGDRVINVFDDPSPNMRMEKWPEGDSMAAPGGTAIYNIRYINDGSVVADPVSITDTLPANTTYITDTSGFPANLGSGVITWSVGPVDAGEDGQFLLVLTNTANTGDVLHNQVDVFTPYDNDDGNNHAEADITVGEATDAPDVWVNKNPASSDPYPGQPFLYQINYGNNGPVASGSVVLTDTLPDNTKVITWFSQNDYALWVEDSTATEFVLKAPALPGNNWGDQIMLWLELDSGVAPGTQLTNTVEITTAGDSDSSNNWHQRDDWWVSGEERWDVAVYKAFNWGRLVPGGQVQYNLHFRNDGNMTTPVWIEDTLPVGTSYVEAWGGVGRNWWPLPPDSQPSGKVRWDTSLGDLMPGEWMSIDLLLNIGSVQAGSYLTNCAEIGMAEDDMWPRNNQSCIADRINETGPNLRVHKGYDWDNDGRIGYSIRFENVGTTNLEGVLITDTYPVDMTFNGDWHGEGGQGVSLVSHDAGSRQITFHVDDRMDPTNSGGFRIYLDLDNPGIPGQIFTNTVVAPIDGDVWPQDNADQVVAYTGPDVFARKWLSAGEPKPGEIVTFTIEFGNQNRWPWNGNDQYGSHITDTLPPEMTFITATAPWNPNDRWGPEVLPGNVLAWEWGPMWSDSLWTFDLAVQITDTVEGGDVIVNSIEAYGDSPEDVEPDYGNNTQSVPVTIVNPKFEVDKSYEGSGVAGTVVTYTLTATNMGNQDGTQVVLKDVLPAGLVYGGSDGTQSGGEVSWTFASIAASGGTATGQIWGTLPCVGTVTNDTYSVTSSDQGVTSANGAPVSIAVTAPTVTASFDKSASSAFVDATLYFTDTSTTDGPAIVTWSWDFGDSTTGSGPTASHAYTAVGSYDVTLTVIDACGNSDDLVTTINVSEAKAKVYLPIVLRNH